MSRWSLPAELWQRFVALATALCLVTDVGYLLIGNLESLLHSDAAVPVLMGAKIPSAGPVFRDWYYANGDVWVFGPHWWAAITVAIFGVGVESLRAALLIGFVIEIAVLVWCYETLGAKRWVAFVAAAATLMAWSRLQVLFVYVEPSYGFVATFYILLFTLAVRALHSKSTSWARYLPPAACLFVLSLQNPTRSFLFTFVPLLVTAAWPWRGLARFDRLKLLGALVSGLALSFLVYRFVFVPNLTFSPAGRGVDFRVRDAAGLAENLKLLGQGVIALSGTPHGPSVVTIPGFVLLAGAFGFFLRHLFTSRALEPIRFLSVAIATQLGTIALPVVIGNLLTSPFSIRYLLPGILPVLGIAVLLAAKASSRAARGWLMLLPGAALVAFVQVRQDFVDPVKGQWAHRTAHPEVANELERRGLGHGFATYWNANFLSLVSRSKTRACPVYFADVVIPQKWNVDTPCFDPKAMPKQVYFVAAADEREAMRKSIAGTKLVLRESFVVSGFEVAVVESTPAVQAFLDLPLPTGTALAFPLRLPAAHLAFRRGNVEADGTSLVGKGEDGTLVFGPYMELPAGRYRVRWRGRVLSSAGEIAFDATGRNGEEALAARKIPATSPDAEDRELVRLDITLARTTPGIELRVFAHAGGNVLLREVVLEKD